MLLKATSDTEQFELLLEGKMLGNVRQSVHSKYAACMAIVNAWNEQEDIGMDEDEADDEDNDGSSNGKDTERGDEHGNEEEDE